MQSKKLKIHNEQGQHLGARLDLPVDGEPLAYALFAHCFTCNKNLRAVGNISRALNGAGIAVLRFDFTGLGESEGDFADTNFSSNVADLVNAANFLASEYEAPQILVGHSLGGAAVLQAAQFLPEVKAVVTLGAPANPVHVTHMLTCEQETIERTGQATVSIAGREFTIKKQFLDDIEAVRMEETIGNLRRALLVMHSPIDKIVGVNNAAEIFTAAKHPKSFVSLDHADHLMSDKHDSEYAGEVIATWARKYITVRQKETLEIEFDNRVTVHTGRNKYRTDIRASGHSLIADEPIPAGTDLGPNPYDYLLSALGACTTMTLRMYADRKGWPLDDVVVRLTHQKIHAKDCADCESTSGKVDGIDREIELFGDLDETQRTRLLEIADKCPVHRTLHSEIKIRSKLK